MVPRKSEKSEIATFCASLKSDGSDKSEIATFHVGLRLDTSGRSGLEANPWFPKSRKSLNTRK